MAGPTLGSVAEGAAGMQLDLQQIQMNQFKLAEAPLQLQKEQIELQRDKLALTQQMRMLSLMQNVDFSKSDGTPDGMAGVLDQMSMIQLQSGNPDAAAKTAKEASTLRENASKTDYRSYRMRNDRLSKFADILNSVPNSPEGWQQAISAIASQDPTAARDPTFIRLSRQPWDPQLIRRTQAGVLTLKDQAEVSYREKATQHQQALIDAQPSINALRAAQTRYTNDRDTKIKKEAGSETTPIKASDLQAMTDMIEQDYPGSMLQDERARARPLVEEAIKDMANSPGKSRTEIIRTAYERGKKEGVFGGMRPAPLQPGAKAAQAKPLPAGVTDVKKLQQNQWYKDPRIAGGQPFLVIGGKGYTEAELKGDEGEEEEDEDAD